MTEATWGKVTARGSDAFVKLVRLALNECVNVNNPKLEDRLPTGYTIEEHTPEQFKQRGFVFDDGTVNEGRVASAGLLWVNSRIVRGKPRRARHIVRHEISHILPLSEAKKHELMALMWKKNGTHPRRWSSKLYEAQPEECHADTMAEAMSGIDSPWDDFTFYLVDVQELDHPKFLDITFRVDPPPPIPDPPPPIVPPSPVPLPPEDPVVAELEARLEAIEKIAAGELGLIVEDL